jgi:hypothetical protein
LRVVAVSEFCAADVGCEDCRGRAASEVDAHYVEGEASLSSSLINEPMEAWNGRGSIGSSTPRFSSRGVGRGGFRMLVGACIDGRASAGFVMSSWMQYHILVWLAIVVKAW